MSGGCVTKLQTRLGAGNRPVLEDQTVNVWSCNQQECFMIRNIGSIDRVLRILVGLAIFSLVFVGPQTPWGYIGLILVGTALINFCPIYRLIGVSTCSRSA